VQIGVKGVFGTGHGALPLIAHAPVKKELANSLRPGVGRNVHVKVSSSQKKFKPKISSSTHDSIPSQPLLYLVRIKKSDIIIL
jgi:hypothetical protein